MAALLVVPAASAHPVHERCDGTGAPAGQRGLAYFDQLLGNDPDALSIGDPLSGILWVNRCMALL